MTANLAALAPPLFLSRNYINGDADDQGAITCSSGNSFRHRIYDMDRGSYWSSLGSDDATVESITAGLYQGSVQADRTIDFIALMGINLKRFKLEYSADDGANYSVVPGADYSAADFSSDNLILSLSSPITANKIRLIMYSTQTANAEKQVSDMIAALLTIQTTDTFSDYDPLETPNIKDVKMADGTIDFGVVRRSDDSFVMFSAQVEWEFMSLADKESLRAIYKSGQPFLFMPEPGDSPDEIYLCRFKPGSFKTPYTIKYRGAGFSVKATIEEVGGG